MLNRIVLISAAIVMVLCQATALAGQKVLLIDSYHEGYQWSDDIIAGAKGVIGEKYELKIIHMDTKRNGSEDFKKAAGEKVKAEIDTWKPDAVIACDDNSAKYVIVPFFKDSAVPFVFAGINWDASSYGFPCSNVTGILEVSVVGPLVDTLRKSAKGDRIGILGADNETDRKEAVFFAKKLGRELTDVRNVKTFAEWTAAYTEMQDKVDMLMVTNYAGIKDWDVEAAKKLTREVTKVPSGSSHDFMAPLVLITYAKLGSEQGAWAAGTAIKIIEGTKVSEIPVASNEKGQFYANLPIAGKLGVKIGLDTLKVAKIVKE